MKYKINRKYHFFYYLYIKNIKYNNNNDYNE